MKWVDDVFIARMSGSDEINNELYSLQRRLLAQGLEMLKPNGILVYSTCSLCPRQNEDIVNYFADKIEILDILDSDLPSEYIVTRKDKFVYFDPRTSGGTSGLFIAKLKHRSTSRKE